MKHGTPKKMMITGVSGLLGNNLALYFRDRFEVVGIYHTHKVDIEGIRTVCVELCSAEETAEAIRRFTPDIIIHCAALASPDLCEVNRDLAERVNVASVANIVEALKDREVKLIYISTDLVFDGEKGNYSETDTVNPINFYGETKYKGELEALRHEKTIVARTNIFGKNILDKRSLAEWIIYELSNKRQITGFTDAIFSSIYTIELARLLEQALEAGLSGIYHFASKDSLSKYEFAVELAKAFGLDTTLIRPSSIDDFGFTAKRAKNVSLNVIKLGRDIKADMPTIQSSIQSFHRDYQNKSLSCTIQPG